MKNLIIVILLSGLFFLNGFANENAKHSDNHSKEENHKHSEDESKEHPESDGHDHEDSGHGEEKGHAHGGEEGAASGVGPEKGITEKTEEGFKLSPEAEKTIAPKTEVISGGDIRVPVKAIVTTKSEKSVFRLRDGWYKRVPIQVANKDQGLAVIKSTQLKAGDKVVVSNAGFLRIAEVFSEEGAEHTH